MIIELRGIDFDNKGAELMLRAIMAKIKEEIPGALFVMEKTNNAPRSMHLKYGIYTKTNFNTLGIPWRHVFQFIPALIRKRWSYINENEIRVVLDASGFAFGDIWGVKKALARLGRHVIKWKKQGKKIILLPQAFGPFLNRELAVIMKTIINHTDLIFARDKISYKYLSKLQADTKKLDLAPDFTSLVPATIPPYFDSSRHEVAIIANSKMIETATKDVSETYMDFLYRVIKIVWLLGYKPFFLIHEEKTDRKLAESVNERLSSKLPVLQDKNSLYVKGIIAQSRAVVSSRFHGLVSSLSQAVPCLATGWSHKYEMLLEDYDYKEGMLEVNASDDLLLEKLNAVLTDPYRYLIIQKLKREAVKQQQRTHEMWEKIFKKIKNSYGYAPHFTPSSSKIPLVKDI